MAGVASGVAEHLGLDVWVVRTAFVVLTFVNGAGLVAYGALWVLAPQRGGFDPLADLEVQPEDPDEARPERDWRLAPLLPVAALVIGLILLFQRLGVGFAGGFTLPLLVAGLGVAVLWRVADDSQRARWRQVATTRSRRHNLLRFAAGLGLVSLGVGAMLAVNGGLTAALYGLSALVVVIVGALAIAGPWLYRLTQEVRAERLARIRSQERAELAAHVHDSVLQTLTLVQRHADDPREVVRLARAEERALRGWLYDPERASSGTFGPSLERIAAEVEERHGVTVDVVVVGDAAVDEGLSATLQAAREAMVNAAKYAPNAPVSVYAEIGEREVDVFVRDRGPGFDLATVPEDRHGLRESVVGRMERHGGRATIRSSDRGTEVELEMPRESA